MAHCAAVAVGDELLAGEGETDFNCIENDIDERLDTTEVELLKALKKSIEKNRIPIIFPKSSAGLVAS